MVFKDTGLLASAVLTLETKITCAGIMRQLQLSRSLLFLLLKCSSSATAQASGTARQ